MLSARPSWRPQDAGSRIAGQSGRAAKHFTIGTPLVLPPNWRIMPRLTDQVAIVTGAAQGLGRAFCAKLADEGARIVAADINLDGATAAARALPNDALPLKVDVSQESDT